jgi:dipeptidyl aminopeptidase/acylaminoacyl peptidase
MRIAICIAAVTICAALARGAALPVAEVLQAPALAPFSSPSFSPDNRLLAYVVTDTARRRGSVDDDAVLRSGVAWYAIAADIWTTDLVTSEKQNLTRSMGHNWTPQWSPDGRYLAFLADRSNGAELGPARLWVWERASGTLRQASEADVREGYREIQWAAGGQEVLVNVFPEELGRDEYVERVRGGPRQDGVSGGSERKSGARVFEFDPTVPNATPSTDQVNLDLWRRDLALIDIRTGAMRRVVRGVRVGHYALSSDGRQLAYSVLLGAEKPGAGQYIYDVVTLNLATLKARTVASNVRLTLMGSPLAWSPGADRIAWRTGGPLALDELYVVAATGGKSRRIATNPAVDDQAAAIDVLPLVWDPQGRHIFFSRAGVLWRSAVDGSRSESLAESPGLQLEVIAPRQQLLASDDTGKSALVLSANPSSKRVGFATVNLHSGAVSQLIEENKRYGGYGTEPTISRDGSRIAYVAEDSRDPPNIFVLENGERESRKASEVAPSLVRQELGASQVLEWRSTDGEPQRGALVLPAGYRTGTSYPLIVKVYGGSSISNDLNRFGNAAAAVENLQLFATRGYAVLAADSQLGVGSPMVDLMKSVMPGIDRAVELGIADPKRIGITGHSYGGYSALALIVQSPRFKAAVMRAGSGNLISGYGHLAPDGSNYGISWAETGQGRMGGSPWEFRERYIENSPIFYLDRVQTPLLIIHGERDDAVPVFLADEIFSGLRRLGRPVSYARYAGESHWEGTWSYANQVEVLERQIAWFDRHLKAAEQ